MTVRRWVDDPLHREGLLLVAVLVVSGVATHHFTRRIVATTLRAGGLVEGAYGLASTVMGSTSLLQAALLGVWLGVLVVWMLDSYKQLQVPIPLVVGATFLHASGFSPLAFVTSGGVVKLGLLVLFTLFAIQLCGIPLTQSFRPGRILSAPPREFRRAPMALALSVSFVVVVGLVDAYLVAAPTVEPVSRQVEGMFGYLLSGGVLVVLFAWIADYDNQVRVIQIGPAQAGKTSMIGGLYADITSSGTGSGSDRVGKINRAVTANRLDGISKRIGDEMRFPDRTDEMSELRFSYYCRDRIFRKKNTIASLDYPGEKLTGGKDEQGIASRLQVYQERQADRRSRIGRTISSLVPWAGGVDDDLWTDGSRTDSADTTDTLGRHVMSADIVLFTLPMADFLAPMLRDGETPPPYANVHVVEAVDEGQYVVTTPDGESVEVERRYGELVEADTGEAFAAISFESYENLPKIDDSRRYHVDKEHDDPEEYVREYDEIIARLPDGQQELVWTVTMTDLVYDHFESAYDRVTEEFRDDGQTTGRLQFLADNDMFDGGPSVSTDVQDFKLLGKWILEEFVSREVTRFDNTFEKTQASYLYPMWFDIAGRTEGGKLIIDDGPGRMLNCSKYLLDRIEGRRLEGRFITRHPDYSLFTLLRMQLSPVAHYAGLQSPIDVAHELMHEGLSRDREAAAESDAE